MEKVKKKVLVVDDEPCVALALENNINDWGHDVTVAESYSEAKKLIDTKFDVVVVDIFLIGEAENGKMFRDEYRSKYPETLILPYTAHHEIACKMRLNAEVVVEKPDIDGLRHYIEGHNPIDPKVTEVILDLDNTLSELVKTQNELVKTQEEHDNRICIVEARVGDIKEAVDDVRTTSHETMNNSFAILNSNKTQVWQIIGGIAALFGIFATGAIILIKFVL